jgi:hypothetical protein
MRTELVFGGSAGPWWPTRPSAATLCPTFCWLADSNLESSLETCINVYCHHLNGEFGKHASSDVEKAATDLFRAVDEVLTDFDGNELVAHWRHDIPRIQQYAKKALLAYMTVQEMKQIQSRSSAGTPLAVCTGKLTRETRFAEIDPDRPDVRALMTYSRGDGCGVVHPDSLRAETKLYCNVCRPRDSNRQRAIEAEERARYAGREVVLDAERRRVWQGLCVCCDSEFTNPRPDAKRCDECRKRGRKNRGIKQDRLAKQRS